ncbi:MAG: C4-dicarboxylate ABC transporter permease [Candidatus Tectimicrobiota bacterium]|nr:MAG: C4-dicarboxylate ABC transporter permease [Candidatus Tectomicrobia bacterium]
MDPTLVAVCSLAFMFLLLAAGMPIGLAMGLAGTAGTLVLLDARAALALLGQTAYETAITYSLSVVPLFVLMGSFATHAGLSRALYRACHAWLGHRRGGLALATIGACGAFAAICGSSLATAATMTQVALPEMRRYHYSEQLATGAIAAGGTIGILIPPSVILVLYGILTETSIGELFLAGIVPGVLTVLGFMLTVALVTRRRPELGPRGPVTGLGEKLRTLRGVWGTLALFLLVMGGIYLGIFTPTEAAGIGAAGALLLGILARQMTPQLFLQCLVDTVKTTAMIFTILIGAIVFNNFLVLSDLPGVVGRWISTLHVAPHSILVIMLLLYFLMGCALDSLAMVLLTIPIFFPIVAHLGFDPVWFGVIVVMVVELGLITPPIGMNVFVIKGLAPEVGLDTIYRGVVPFVIAQVLLIALLVACPWLATWLPRTMH